MNCYFEIAASHMFSRANIVPSARASRDLRYIGNWCRELANSPLEIDSEYVDAWVTSSLSCSVNNRMFNKQSDYNLRQQKNWCPNLGEISTDFNGADTLASEKVWLSSDFSHGVHPSVLRLHQTTLVKLMKWSLYGLVQMTVAVTLPELFISIRIVFSVNNV